MKLLNSLLTEVRCLTNLYADLTRFNLETNESLSLRERQPRNLHTALQEPVSPEFTQWETGKMRGREGEEKQTPGGVRMIHRQRLEREEGFQR